MSFIPFITTPRKARVYENVLGFRTHTTVIRVWVDRGREGPSDQEDYVTMTAWVQANRSTIDHQPPMDTAEMLAEQFPRICAVEVLNGSRTNGVLLYPRWP